MSQAQAQIVAQLLPRDETRMLEFKRLRGAELTKILRSITAFANTAGGLLVLGMEDFARAQGTDRLYGIEENEPAVDDLRRELRTRVIPPIGGELGPEPVFHRLSCTLRNGQPGHLMAIEVRPSKDLHSIAEGGTWERLDKGNRQLSAAEITDRRLRLGATSVVDQPVEVPFELLDTPFWHEYRVARGSTAPFPEALKHMGLAKLLDGAWKPTRLAALLFAQYPSDLLGEKCAVRIFQYSGDEVRQEGNTYNFLRPPITIGGPVFPQIRETLKAVVSAISKGVQMGPLGMEIVQSYPLRVLQEAITNAVLHRDYRLPTDVHVRLFANRIEVESPGLLPHRLRLEDLGKVGSKPRNPSLTGHLRDFQDAPNFELGEGIRMMNTLMREADLFPPVFQLSSERESFTVILRNQARPSLWDQAETYLETHPTIGNAEVRQLLRTEDPTKASRQLKSWVDGGLLVVADPSASRSHRRYRRPGTAPQEDLFGNSPTELPDDQEDG